MLIEIESLGWRLSKSSFPILSVILCSGLMTGVRGNSEIEHIWQVIYRFGFYRGGPVMMSALSGVGSFIVYMELANEDEGRYCVVGFEGEEVGGTDLSAFGRESEG